MFVQRKLTPIAITFMLLFAASIGRGANGTWTNDANSVWSDTLSWLNGTVADGTDATADFSTFDITADRTVTLDSSRNIGGLTFGDVAGAQNWNLNSSGNSVLTLSVSSGSPTVSVTNNTANINATLAGTAGLTKAGGGTLVLGGTNTYTGATTVNAGTLKLTNAVTSDPILYMSFDNVSGNTVINDGSQGATANGLIVGTNVSIVAGGINGNALLVSNGPVNTGYVLVNTPVINFNNPGQWSWAMWLKTSTAGASYMYQGDGGWASGNTSFYLNQGSGTSGTKAGGVRNSQGWETGTAAINNGNWHFIVMTCTNGTKALYVDGVLDTLTVNAWNGAAVGSQLWIGGSGDTGDGNQPLNGMIDEVYIYNRALSAAEVTSLYSTSTTAHPVATPLLNPTDVSVASGAKLDLNGRTMASTSLTGAGTVDNSISNQIGTLTISNNSSLVLNTYITNAQGNASIFKAGTGALTITGTNGYSGITTLANGTLNFNSSKAIGSSTLVIKGGTLDNTFGTSITSAGNNAGQWVTDFTFTGTTNLNLGAGPVTLLGLGTNRTVNVNANTLTIGRLVGNVGPGYALTKTGVGTLSLGSGGSSTISGNLNVLGGTVQIGANDFTAGGLTGSGTVENGSGTIRWLFVNTPNTNTFTGTLRDNGARMGLNKLGTGKLIITGSNTYSDTTTIQNGFLTVTGTNTFTAGNFGLYNVGANGNQNGVLEIAGGTVNANKNASPSVQVAAAANARGFIRMLSSGTFTTASELHIGQGSGAATTTPYAAMTMGGTSVMTNGSYLVVGFNNDRAVFNQLGGTVAVNANVMTIGAGGTGSIGVANLSGGTFAATAASGGIFVGERGIGILNVLGSAAVSVTNVGLNVGPTGSQTGWDGTANLLGGTVSANKVVKGVGTGVAKINFNGGTLKATIANPTFMTGLDSAYVYANGATIDDGGFAITVGQQLLAPSGQGVASIPVTAGGSGYIDTPLVLITNVDGSGATAIAQIDYTAGTVTNILITSPGNNYSTPPSVTLFGGGGTGATLGTPTLAANVSGGLTKVGAGTLTLTTGNTYAGATRVLGGVLNLTPSTLSTAGDLVVSNGTAALDVSSGSAFNAVNVALQSNAVVNISYGSLVGNPGFAAINASGNLSSSGTNTLNLSGGSSWTVGEVPLIAYTGTTLPSISNFKLGTLPPGMNASLTNDVANHWVALNISFIGQTLTWFGTNTLWDINTTFNWNSAGAKYLEYSGNTFGDLVTFDDNLYNDFTNPQSTNVNLTTTLHPSQITVNSSLPYSFTGTGSLAGSGSLTKLGLGVLTLGTANSYSGGTILSSGGLLFSNAAAIGTGSLTINGGALDSLVPNLVNANNNAQIWNGDFYFLGSQSLNLGTGAVSMPASRLITVMSNTLTVGGGISGSAFTLTSAGAGTLALSGSNTLANLVANQGTITLSGNGSLKSISDVWIGNTAGQAAALYQSGSAYITNTDTGGGAIQIGRAVGGAGYYNMTGGTVSLAGEINIGGISGGAGTFGQLDLTGGTINIPDRSAGTYFLVNRSSAGGAAAVVNVLGGTIQVFGSGIPTTTGLNGLAVNWTSSGAADTATVTIGNGGQIVTPSITTKMNMGVNFNGLTGNSANVAALNLNTNGLLQTLGFLNGVGNNPNVYVNFNGGTLKAGTANNASFLASLGGAYVYGGGATIDDNGKNITIGQALLAPSGNGVSSISLTDGGSGYIAPPQVVISGDGTGATAYATINPASGAVTGIVVTCPGTGYTSASASLTGIGYATAATVGTVNLSANNSGGLTKVGAGTLTLLGADTYSGSTLVSTGEVFVTPAHQVSGGVTVANGASFGVILPTTNGAASIGSLTLATGSSTLDFSFGTNLNTSAPILLAGPLTNNSTCTIRIGGTFSVGAVPLLTYSGSLHGSGSFNTIISAPHGVTATVSNSVSTSTLYAVITQVGGGIVWTGTNAVSPSVWDINTTTNWLSGGSPVTYAESVPPGDAVIFSDIGNGTVLLSNTVSPASVQFTNSSVNYTVSGTGKISGTTGITKRGTGITTMNLSANDYSGNTVISNGTLQLGSATAIPSGTGKGDVIVGSAGTLDLAGVSPGINGLSGSGVINNSSGAGSTLTVGNNDAGGTFSGAITNTGAGTVTLLKVGTNSLTLAGTNFLGGTSQFNGGTNYLTGVISNQGTGEFWIQQNAGSSTFIVNGGSLSVNSWLVVGRNNAAANGTLIVNSGTVTKAGGNNIVVGSLNATGTLIVNGGQVLNNGNLWLGENGSANASLYLNGGLIQATQVRPNGTAPASSIAYFNGGTLQATASSTNFILLPTYTRIQSGGLVLDDNGFSLTLGSTPLAEDATSPGGGLVKKGSGTVYLNVANNYTGVTLVTNGTLAGIGQIESPVLVAPAGNIAAGDGTTNLGTFSLSYTTPHSLTIQGKATLRIRKNGGTPTSDLITGIDTANYGGTLVVSNATTDATPLSVGDSFTLFSANTHSGNFTNIVGSPGTGLAYSFTNGVLSVVSGVVNQPVITTISISGSNLTISGTNGTSGQQFRVLSSTNLTLPIASWTPIYTNTFTGSPFSATVPITLTTPQDFYMISIP